MPDDEDWREQYLGITDWVADLEFLPPAHFQRIATMLQDIVKRLKGLISLEPPDDGSDFEQSSIKVKRGAPVPTNSEPGESPSTPKGLIRNDPKVMFSPILLNSTNSFHSAINAGRLMTVTGRSTGRSKVDV